jgi:PAS domain S-box-containing protein
MKTWQKVAGVLAFLMATSILVSVSHQLAQKVENFSFARSDSDSWNFAQVEVAYDRFQMALQDGLIELQAEGRISGEIENEIVMRFDIFYSRVDTVADRFGLFVDQLSIQRTLAEVQKARDQLTILVDRRTYLSPSGLRQLLDLAEQKRPFMRDFALDAMQAAIVDQERERTEVYASLRNSTRSLTGLVFFLLALGTVLIFLWRRLAEKNASERNLITYLTKLLEVSSDGIVVVDENLQIKDVNKAAQRTFGYERDALLGADVVRKLGTLRRHNRISTQLRAILEGKLNPEHGLRSLPIVARRENGSVFPAALSVVRVRDQTRNRVLVGFVRDLSTERQSRRITRRALAQARNDAAAKQRFLATMSHEMRTPLHSIVVAADMAQHADTAAEMLEHLPTIRAAAQTALYQVEDVLDIAAEGGKSAQKQAENFDARSVAKSVFLQMTPLAAARGNTLVFDWDGPAHLRGSPQNLFKIVYNLVSNAIKATKNGTVRISAQESTLKGKPAMQIAITDTGRGISEGDQQKIFEDFVSRFKTYENGCTGTGLGLGIVTRALQAMDGQIELQSKLGQGSVFRATIPQSFDGIAPVQEAKPISDASDIGPASDTAPTSHAPRQSGKVLVIEDHATNRKLLEHMLMKLGYGVTSAADGLEGLQKALEQTFDLILTDINMPELTGDKVARCLRHAGGSGNACIIAVTAKATIPMTQRASIIEGGIDAFLYKPFDSAKLEDVLHDAVEECTFDTRYKEPKETDLDLYIGPELLAKAGQDVQELLAMLPGVTQPGSSTATIDELGRFAHYVAGGILFAGFHRLGNALLDLERMCHDRDTDCIRGMQIVLEAEADSFLSDIAHKTIPD